MTGGLAWAMAYQRAFRARVAGEGLLAVAPASLAFTLVTLVVSAVWREPGAEHRVVAACCAWRATTLTHGAGALVPLFGSAFLVRRPVEAIWTVAATWLLLGPLEAAIGSRRLLLAAAFGHALPTLLVDLCWLAGSRVGGGLEGIDAGTSAVVVTAAAALAVVTRSPPLGAALAAGLAVDLATTPDLASAEHVVAVVVGIGAALLILLPDRWPGWRSELVARLAALPRSQATAVSHRYRPHA
jgi:hypothetical protein